MVQHEVKELNQGDSRLQWTQVGSKGGGTWHEGGVRWVSLGMGFLYGKRVQIGHVAFRPPSLVDG